MKRVLGLLLLVTAAVIAAAVLGRNEGLVSVFWGPTRYDFSLNLFIAGVALLCLALFAGLHLLNLLVGLPERAAEYRASRADRQAQSTLRHALAYFFGGRYTRAHKAAMRAVALHDQARGVVGDHEFEALAHLLAAGSLHRLQDRTRRDDQLALALAAAGNGKGPRPAEEGARLLSAEWALDDRNAPLALERLASLSPGVARRTQALRLKLQATRLAGAHTEALRTARLLAKHQAFSAGAAVGLLRTLADRVLDGARDADQLRHAWLELDAADRRDAYVAARAAARISAFGDAAQARQWLQPFCDQLATLGDEEREAVCAALVTALPGLPADWLPRLEAAALAVPRDPMVAHAVGRAYFERQLWGKARRQLEIAARTAAAPAAVKRDAWLHLAHIAAQEDKPERVAECHEQAALVA